MSQACSNNSFEMHNNTLELRDSIYSRTTDVDEQSSQKFAELNKERLRKCKRILYDYRTRASCLEFTFPFIEAVDPIKDEVPDYYEIVKNPMNINQMNDKMSKGAYKTPEDFESDMRLIISNCRLYNESGHILDLCKKLEEHFNSRFSIIMKENMMLRSSFSFRSVLPDDKKYLLKELARANDYSKRIIEKLQSLTLIEETVDYSVEKKPPRKRARRTSNKKKQVNGTVTIKDEVQTPVKKIPEMKPEVPDSSDDDMLEPLTHEQKQEIARNINELPDSNIREVCKILKELEPKSIKFKADGGFELELKDCRTQVLKKVEKYIHDFKHPKVKRAAPLPRAEKLKKDPELVMKLKGELDAQEKDLNEQIKNSFEKRFGLSKPSGPALSSSSSSSGSSKSDESSSGSDSSTSDDEN